MRINHPFVNSALTGLALLVFTGYSSFPANAGTLPDARKTELTRTVTSLMDQLPMRFEANDGQLNPKVKYFSKTSEHVLFLTQTEAVLAFESGTLRISLPNGNHEPQVSGIDVLPSTSDYFIGNDQQAWRTNVPHYGRISYHDVYPGIDLIYYGKGKQLEHDFVVAPGADPQSIRMRFEGADSLRLGEDGDLTLDIGGAQIQLSRPLIYQESAGNPGGGRVEVAGNYVLLGDSEIGFSLEEYDREKTLVIDPILSYSTYLGGSLFDIAAAVKADTLGNIWVAGYTISKNFPVNDEAIQLEHSGNQDVFVAKLDPYATGAAALEYSSYLGGASRDEALGMCLDSDGNVYLTGYTISSNFPTTGLPYQSSRDGAQDAFVAKLWRAELGANKLAFSTYFGGEKLDIAYGIAVDESGNIIIAGSTTSEEFPIIGSPYQSAIKDGWDAFIAKLTPEPIGEAALLYSTYLGGSGTDVVTGLMLDDAGMLHLTGYTTSDDYPMEGQPYQSQYAGNGDVFMTRFDLTEPALPTLDYSTYLGGSGFEIANAIAVGELGAVHLAGYTTSDDFPVSETAAQGAYSGNADAFAAKLDPALPDAESLLYSTYLGGSWTDVAYGVSLDSAGGIFVTGYTTSSDFPVSEDAFQSGFGGLYDAFITLLDPELTADEAMTYSSYFGGSGMDAAYASTVDELGNFYVTGFTQSTQFPVTEGAYQSEHPGIFNSFVSRFEHTPLAPLETDETGEADGDQ